MLAEGSPTTKHNWAETAAVWRQPERRRGGETERRIERETSVRSAAREKLLTIDLVSKRGENKGAAGGTGAAVMFMWWKKKI